MKSIERRARPILEVVIVWRLALIASAWLMALLYTPTIRADDYSDVLVKWNKGDPGMEERRLSRSGACRPIIEGS